VKKKPTRLSKTTEKIKTVHLGAKTASSDPVLELIVLHQKLDLTWIFLHGCKP